MRGENISTWPRSSSTKIKPKLRTHVPEADLLIKNQRGLHARAASKFVKIAAEFDANISVSKDEQTVSGLSIMGLMMLAAAPGDTVTLLTEGPQAIEAFDALKALIEDKFQET